MSSARRDRDGRLRPSPLQRHWAATLPSLPLSLLGLFVVMLGVAGGASVADVTGQAVIRATATLCLATLALFGPRPDWRPYAVPGLVLLGAIVLTAAYLIPLPPSIWLKLPGRAAFAEAAIVAGQTQPWRPIAIVPAGAINALGALLVPVAMLALLASLAERERVWLPGGLLVFIALTALVGGVQAISASFENPLINDAPGEVTGLFANRNHFALLLAVGCLVAPVWAGLPSARGALGWRGPVALVLVLLYTLLILLSGSRAGLLLGAAGGVAGTLLVLGRIRGAISGQPRWLLPALLLAAFGAVAALVVLSFNAERAFGINRALTLNAAEDLRAQASPTVAAMVRTYFPVGTGGGSFDALFRLHEPFVLLQPLYFNHAHNDLLEIALEYGLAGILLLLATAIIWLWWAARAWRPTTGDGALLARTGLVILLMTAAASAVDYPARTPIIMALIVLAAAWAAPRRSLSVSAAPLASGR